MKKFLTVILCFALLLVPVPSAAAEVYKTINSKRELIDYVTEQSETLRSPVKVRIKNYSEAEYTIDFTEHLPIQISEMKGLVKGTEAEITYTFTYTQAERVLYYLTGGIIPLNEKEILTANAAKAVYGAVIKEGMTDYEKQLAIHDYLILNTAYDYSAAPSDDAFTPYGALVNKLAVCQGYTEAARILLSMAGVWNDTLSGTADGQSHMWNIVRLDDGELYHMDVTWDDERIFEDGTNVLSRAFLNMTDEQIDLSHDWDTVFQLERFGEGCTATEYNYLRRNGMAVTSNEEYINLVTQKYNSGEKEIEALFLGMNINDADIKGAAIAIGSGGYAGFHIDSANVLLMRFK